MRKKVSCLICCRGGSKGIPGKNIKEFCGKPLLRWTLKNAKEANVFDEIILSTDKADIADVGKKYGAKIPRLRPDYLAEDDSDVFETHAYVFNQLSITDKTHIVCILTNNPFIDSKLIETGYKIASSEKFQYIALDTVSVDGDYLYFKQLYKEKKILKFYYPDKMKQSGINRQSYLQSYTTINNMRWGKPSFMTNYDLYKNEIINNGILPIPLPKIKNFDIDDMQDWEIAEAIFEKSIL